jgi:hypothetical protein
MLGLDANALGENMRKSRLLAFVVAVTTIAAGGEAPNVTDGAAASTSATSPECTLVMGGGGTVTPNAAVNSRWFAINRAVTIGVIEALRSKGYAVEQLIVDIRDANKRLAAMARELAHDKCTQVLQITHALNSDPASFTFSATVLHLLTATSTAGGKPILSVVGDYEQKYSYPLTKEAIDAWSLSGLGARLAADVDDTRILRSHKP